MKKNNPTKITAEPGKQEIIITREFDAPRELVFKAFTDPELFVQWIGPRGLEMTLETFESRNGGSWRYIQKDADGNEFAFHDVNHEILSPERIIGTFEFEGLPESPVARIDFREGGHLSSACVHPRARTSTISGNTGKLCQWI